MSKNKQKKISNSELVSQIKHSHGEGHPESIQAELTKRLIESIDKFNSTTAEYTKKLLVLTVLLFIVAVLQLVFSAFSVPVGSLWSHTLSVIVLIGLIIYVTVDFMKIKL